MKTVVVCNPCMKDVMTNEGYFYEWYMDGEEFTVALLDLPDPDFNTMLDSHSVIVKVNAFSCNFRDRALMHHFAWRCKELSVDRKYFYAPIGSEFAGEVVWAGRKVASFHIGDRVFPNNTYPFKPDGTWGGMVTNFASQRLLLVKDSFLMKIPDGMPDEVAAGFSLSAQTGYSMVRKACLKENENVLITALSSNTSLAIIEKLKYSNVNLYACSRRSQELKEQVKVLGIKDVFPFDDKRELLNPDYELKFDVVFDPFIDLYFSKVSRNLNYDARYVFCGFYEQHPSYQKPLANNPLQLYGTCISQNASLIGNCIGKCMDLEDALQDYISGKYIVHIDSVYTGPQIPDFFQKTFLAERFGKVIYKYED